MTDETFIKLMGVSMPSSGHGHAILSSTSAPPDVEVAMRQAFGNDLIKATLWYDTPHPAFFGKCPRHWPKEQVIEHLRKHGKGS